MAQEEHVLSDEVQGNQARVAELIALVAWNCSGADVVCSTTTTITSPSAATVAGTIVSIFEHYSMRYSKSVCSLLALSQRWDICESSGHW